MIHLNIDILRWFGYVSLIKMMEQVGNIFYTSLHSLQQKRLQKELLALQNDPPPGMTLNEKSVQNTITQ